LFIFDLESVLLVLLCEFADVFVVVVVVGVDDVVILFVVVLVAGIGGPSRPPSDLGTARFAST
jgi:hypothetical protein